MLIKFFSKKIPSLRHRVSVTNFKKRLNLKLFFITLKKKNILKKKKYFKKNKAPKLFFSKKIKIPTIFLSYYNINQTLKIYGIYKTIYSLIYLSSNLSCYYPGFRLYSLEYILQTLNNNLLIGQLIPISLIPLNMIITNVYNSSNEKKTYSRSFGSTAVRKKQIKKTKLILIELPSKKKKFLAKQTTALFGSSFFLKKKKLIEGSWGYTLRISKKITVRGVAKNPVDHPNGGRTKTNKPERSPWGWVAKLNK